MENEKTKKKLDEKMRNLTDLKEYYHHVRRMIYYQIIQGSEVSSYISDMKGRIAFPDEQHCDVDMFKKFYCYLYDTDEHNIENLDSPPIEYNPPKKKFDRFFVRSQLQFYRPAINMSEREC